MATAAPITPKRSNPTTEPMIQAAFLEFGITVAGRRATSATAQMTNTKEAMSTRSPTDPATDDVAIIDFTVP
jgi:hypothetical protein